MTSSDPMPTRPATAARLLRAARVLRLSGFRPSTIPLLSPAGLAARAGLLVLVFALCEVAGLREYATFLSGTQQGGQWSSSVLGGVAYLFAYYGFVLVAPILLIAAGLLAGWRRLAGKGT